jgi:hypothetical protein
MIVRKLAIRGKPKDGAPGQKPKKSRVFLFFLLTLGAGALAEMTALVGPGFLASIEAAVTDTIQGNTNVQIAASTLFPPVPVQHKVVDVYDPPPPRAAAPAAPAAAPAASPTPTATPRVSPTPRPSPSPRPTTTPSPRPTPPPGD